MHLHLLQKRTYGDFDIALYRAVAASESLELLELKAAELNAKLTKEELRGEIKYVVEGKIEVL